jgi:surfactin synthase thioesterase subunit
MSDSSHVSAWAKGIDAAPPARLRLFGLPYAGGGSSMFHGWAAGLPLDVQFCPIQLPGREERLTEPPFVRLEPLIQTLADILAPHLGRRFAFFGYSMGALVSFELARELRRRGSPGPLCLYVAAHRAPQLPSADPPIHQLSDPDFLSELKRLNGTPEAVLQHPELRALLLPCLRADFALCETYVHTWERPLECTIIAFGGLLDRRASREELEGWRSQTVGSFSLRMLPGDHFFVRGARAPLLQILSEHLRTLL